MIRSVRDAFIGNFPSLTWMDEKTRDAAKEKAIAITSMIGNVNCFIYVLLLEYYQSFSLSFFKIELH